MSPKISPLPRIKPATPGLQFYSFPIEQGNWTGDKTEIKLGEKTEIKLKYTLDLLNTSIFLAARSL
jgi:hypothetical protein